MYIAQSNSDWIKRSVPNLYDNHVACSHFLSKCKKEIGGEWANPCLSYFSGVSDRRVRKQVLPVWMFPFWGIEKDKLDWEFLQEMEMIILQIEEETMRKFGDESLFDLD